MNLRFWSVGLVWWSCLSLGLPVMADTMVDALTDDAGRYIGPSLEDNVVRMDTDKNGFADVFEVRAYLESQHGKGYEKELLDKWEASASGKSCTTPFAKELYSDSTQVLQPN